MAFSITLMHSSLGQDSIEVTGLISIFSVLSFSEIMFFRISKHMLIIDQRDYERCHHNKPDVLATSRTYFREPTLWWVGG